MTKKQLQQEIKEKVKEGIKPSHLKRSKSLSDIPAVPPLPSSPCPNCPDLQKQLKKANEDWTNLAQKGVDNLKKDPDPRITELEQELAQTIADATEEITRQETEIKQLKSKLSQKTHQNQDLTKQVNEYQRAAELRINNPFKENKTNFWEDYSLIILCLGTYLFSAWLLSKNPPRNY